MAPIINPFWETASFPHQLIEKLGEQGWGGCNQQGNGCSGLSLMCEGLLMVGDATAASHKPSLGRRLCPGTLTRGVRGAQAQIMDCRRVLKWTYGYGYYASITPVQRNLFEFMQGHAEQTLEKLTHVVEVDLERFLCTEPQVGRQTASARTPSPNWRQNVEKRLVVSERALRERLSVLGYKRTVVRVCIRGREPCYQ